MNNKSQLFLRILIFSLLVCTLFACSQRQSTNQIGETVSGPTIPSSVRPVSSKEPTIVNQSIQIATTTGPATQTSNLTETTPVISPTEKLEPTPTSKPRIQNSNEYILNTGVSERAQLWVSLESRYQIIDFPSGQLTYVDLPPRNCNRVPLPESANVVCVDNKQVRLFDLLSGDMKDLPILNVERVFWTANGKFLFYNKDNPDGSITVYRYDINSNSESVVVKQLDFDCNLCKLSSDGSYYAVGDGRYYGSTSLFGGGNFITLDSGDFVYTSIMAWSPVANHLAYSAGNPNTEIETVVKRLFLVNFDNGYVEMIADENGPFLDSGGWPIWSPDGEKIARHTEVDLCIIDVSQKQEICHDIRKIDPEFNVLSIPAWSPSSRVIAIPAISPGRTNLILYVPEIGLTNILFEEEIYDIFWR